MDIPVIAEQSCFSVLIVRGRARSGAMLLPPVIFYAGARPQENISVLGKH